jgi:predicted nucleic acid-binding protein
MDPDGGVVVDASVAAAWCFEDEASPITDAILDAVVRRGARVPALWLFEMSNVLTMAERRGRLDPGRVAQFLDALLALPIQVDRPEPSFLVPALARVSRDHGITSHDAAYLELAMRSGLPLATLDAALRAAAERAGVTLAEG